MPSRYFPMIIVLLGALAYANGFSGSFILDDSRTIVENPRIRHVFPRDAAEWLEPRVFAKMTFALNYAVGGVNPADYHAANVVIHLVAGLLFYGVLRRTLLLPRMAGYLREGASEVAAAAAAIWVVHPLTTSAVTYISQRYELLMSMFFLMTLYFALRGACSLRTTIRQNFVFLSRFSRRCSAAVPAASTARGDSRTTSFLVAAMPRRGTLWYLFAVGSFALGMASKEVILTAPLVILIYDRIFLAESFGAALSRRRALYVGLVSIVALAVVLAVLAGFESSNMGSAFDSGISFSYALTQCGVIAHYLRLSFWPHPLSIDYAWPIAHGVGEALPSLALISVLGPAILLALRYIPPAGFAGLSFFIILFPTSGFIALPDPIFEHRMYLPLALVVAVVVIAVYAGVVRLKRFPPVLMRRGLAAAAFIVAAALTAASHCRNKAYASEETIWRDVIAKQPDNIRAYINLGSFLYDNGRYEEAALLSARGLTRLPDFNRISHEYLLGMENDPGGGKLFRDVFNYAGVHNTLGLALQASGKLEEAAEHFAEALRLTPGNLGARNNMAVNLFKMGRTTEAVAQWQIVLTASPRDWAANRSLAEALMCMGNAKAAIARYEAALDSKPDDVLSQTRLAWTLAVSGDDALRDGRRAVELAEKAALSVRHGSARSLDILAAAYAETRDFEKAVEIAGRAVALAETEAERMEIEARRALYLNHTPYRESSH